LRADGHEHRQHGDRDVVAALLDPRPDKRRQAAGEGCVEVVDAVVEDERGDPVLEGGGPCDQVAARL